MNQLEKANFYNEHIDIIHPKIKSDPQTKPLWRKLYWTTAKNSKEYKSGCVDIFIEYFSKEFKELIN